MSDRRSRSAREMHRHHVQPEIEIFAKSAGAVGRFQVAVRGRDHAHVHWDLFVAPHGPHFLFLQHAQQLRLHFQRKLADFVEEDCAAVRCMKKAGLRLQGSRERPFFMAEQLAFHQRRDKRTAIHGHKRHLRERPAKMNRARDELFARAAFTGDQHGRARILQPRNHAQNVLNLCRGAGDSVQIDVSVFTRSRKN